MAINSNLINFKNKVAVYELVDDSMSSDKITDPAPAPIGLSLFIL
jgi:hypothetical protein